MEIIISEIKLISLKIKLLWPNKFLAIIIRNYGKEELLRKSQIEIEIY